jgi:probable HAF family extracellular repeat protein
VECSGYRGVNAAFCAVPWLWALLPGACAVEKDGYAFQTAGDSGNGGLAGSVSGLVPSGQSGGGASGGATAGGRPTAGNAGSSLAPETSQGGATGAGGDTDTENSGGSSSGDGACSANPCTHGGVCRETSGGFKCLCPEGFDGTTCELDVDECATDPCVNGGTCTDGVGRYMCRCPGGFSGERCERTVSSCADEPCQNDSTCEDAGNGYKCQCPDGFDGTNCEIDVDACEDQNPCQHGGTCVDRPDGYACNCPSNWRGDNCELDVNECTLQPSPCGQNGCENSPGSYKCECSTGFTGDNCELPTFEWIESPSGYWRCTPWAVNTKGDVIVGPCEPPDTGNDAGFRYTHDGGLVLLDAPWAVFPIAVNGDGSVMVGQYNPDNSVYHAFRWSAADGVQPFHGSDNHTSCVASSVSGDGTVIVGSAKHEDGTFNAFLWTPNLLRDLGNLGGATDARGSRVSDDGKVVVGRSGTQGFRWTAAGGMVPLGMPAGATEVLGLGGISADGSIAIGLAKINAVDTGVLWRGTTPEIISGFGYIAYALSDDGTAAVNCIHVWTQARGSRTLLEAIADAGLPEPAFNGSACVTGLSGDGKTWVGHDTMRGFIIRIP